MAKTTHNPPDPSMAEAAIELAAELLQNAERVQTSAEEKQGAKLARMMKDPNGKTLTMQLSDQAFRSEDLARVADQIAHLLDEYGVPRYFEKWEQLALALGSQVAKYLPALVIPLIVEQIRQETNNVILPSEEKKFRSYLKERRATGTRLNINNLGEAILGEGEASRRLKKYMDLIANPDVEYISVKISSIFSQIHLVAFDYTVERIKDILRQLYTQAMKHHYTHPDGRKTPKFINLDMEEYRDLHLTIAAFTQVLDEPEYKDYRAGIVLQGYLPDSAQAQRDLTEWAMERVAKGGAPIKLRIVKGANLAMEKVEASIHGWEQAPYPTKADVDANYKRMVTYGMTEERAKAANLGIASHNLFDVSYALLLREKMGLEDYVEFEMLEGMANHQARTVKDKAGGLLLYAPIVSRDDFHSAISYLVRRLDENTAEENFLHDLFGMTVGSPEWKKQRDLFLTAYNNMNAVSDQARRQQNRQTELLRIDPEAPFENVADTDFSLRANQEWVKQIVTDWSGKTLNTVPLQINGEEITTETLAEGYDPAQPKQVAYRYALASPEQIDTALETATNAQTTWEKRPIAERRGLLIEVANELAKQRGNFIGVMLRDAGKQVEESDPEISEAIDFANYYARTFDTLDGEFADVEHSALGVVLVTPPWNFPLAIPAGGVLSALMAGNTVIIKPAPETVLTAWHMVNAMWDAGIPRDVLQFVPTTDDEVGRGLVTDERVSAVILTGAYETAQMFLSWKPTLRLFAETSGKNALIITAMADRDQAIKDLAKSAFGHAGQKCSASSLAILEAEVYDDPAFRRQLKDAVASLHIASAHDLSAKMTTVIRQPDPKLEKGLTTLESGEEWLLQPKMIDGNPNLWTPGIKLGVKQGSFFHQTECFGPVLGLMRARDLAHAIDLANDNDYGLTGGLHTLDDREIEIWREKIQVGNAYINRGTTGAIVQRQPFGGWKKSAFGYAKAGGANYTYTLSHWQDKNTDAKTLLGRAHKSYKEAWRNHFSLEHDPSQVLGESNVFRYRKLGRVLLRITPDSNPVDIERVLIATQYCDVPLYISLSEESAMIDVLKLDSWRHISIIVEDEARFINQIKSNRYQYRQRIRAIAPVSDAIRDTAISAHVMIADAPVVSNGRLELRHYLQEQSMTQTTHRYGNIVHK
ncbi:MAG: bifunctional proline dehydrogenase/L-glutamate gamma-semialdehyde dehydrogenase [Phototrophicaceae bacterium]